MGKLSRRKGHAFEREIAAELRALGFEAKRGLSQSRGGGAEEADVVGAPGYHIECKRGKKPNLRAALLQAIDDADRGQVPVAVIKDDRAEAILIIRWEDFKQIVWSQDPASVPTAEE